MGIGGRVSIAVGEDYDFVDAEDGKGTGDLAGERVA